MSTSQQTPSIPTTEAPVIPQPDAPYSITGDAEHGFELRYSTGEVYKGKTEREVLEANAKATHETKLSWRELKHELEEFRTQQQRLADALQPAPPAPSQQELDEQQMREYLANQQAKYFGYDNAAQMKSDLERIKQTTQRTYQSGIAQEFRAVCPEFPDTKEAIEAVAGVLEKTRVPLNEISVEDLKMAHAYCVQYGVYKPLTQEQINAANAQASNVPAVLAARQAAPPMVPTNQPETAGKKNLWDMTAEEIKADYFARYNRGER